MGHQEQLADVRTSIMDAAEKSGNIEFSIAPSGPTKGKSAKQLAGVMFTVRSGDTEAKMDLPELTRLVVFCRENLPNARIVKSGGRVTKPYSATVPADPSPEQMEDALAYVRGNRWMD